VEDDLLKALKLIKVVFGARILKDKKIPSREGFN